MMRCWPILIAACLLTSVTIEERSFTVDVKNRQFLKDGKPFQYASGSIHYVRVPYQYWRDRLMKMKAANLNTVQTYVMWNFHEQEDGVFDFTGQADIENFISITNELGLNLIVRAGPYVCAEWEFGGLPWFLANSNITVRTSDPEYMFYVRRWYKQLLPKLKPHLYANGGNIISIQVENEYGSYYQCDNYYLQQLHQIFKEALGDDIVFFTVDPPTSLKCGTTDSMLATVDFGPKIVTNEIMSLYFDLQNLYGTGGPRVNSEFYSGWMTHWGMLSYFHTNIDNFIGKLDFLLSLKASVNTYMFEGGTSFGYWSGANSFIAGTTVYDVTSYDYSAPMTESGDITQYFYTKFSEIVGARLKNFNLTVPANTTKTAYASNLKTEFVGRVFDVMDTIKISTISSEKAINMEKLGCGYGFILYETVSPNNYAKDSEICFTANSIRDSASIFVKKSSNTKFIGTIFNNRMFHSCIQLSDDIAKSDAMYFLVQNQGRINFGNQLNDQRKGIVGDVVINKRDELIGWKNTVLDISKIFNNLTASVSLNSNDSGFFTARLIIPKGTVNDTFIKPNNFKRGFIWLNGRNLGRYWPGQGPQITLYIPKYYLKPNPEVNTFVIFELEPVDLSMTSISFFKEPIWN